MRGQCSPISNCSVLTSLKGTSFKKYRCGISLNIFFTVSYLTISTFFHICMLVALFFLPLFLCASSTNRGLYEKNSLTRLLPTTPILNHSPGGKTLQLSARTVAAVVTQSSPPRCTKSNRTEELTWWTALRRCIRMESQPTAPTITKTDLLPRIKMSTKVWWPSGASQVSETAER